MFILKSWIYSCVCLHCVYRVLDARRRWHWVPQNWSYNGCEPVLQQGILTRAIFPAPTAHVLHIMKYLTNGWDRITLIRCPDLHYV